ncbi:MAG: glycosyltransferase family 4 protein [Candidatus Nanohaloarchaea archaeon]
MAQESGAKVLRFFNTRKLLGREANKFTRRKMAEAFAELSSRGTEVFCVVSGLAEKMETLAEFKNPDFQLKTVLLPGFYDEETGAGLARRIYKVLVLNRLLSLVSLYYLLNGSRDSINYIWCDPLLGVLLYSLVSREDFILELDDHMFGDSRFADFIYLKAASRARRVTTVSTATKEDLVARGIDSEKIRVVPNAVDLEEFDIEPGKSQLRQRLGMPEDCFIVTYTGHLYPEKGVDTLIEAVQHLPVENLALFIVGGREEDVEGYLEMVEDRNLDGKVNLQGYVPREEIPMHQKASDLLVLPNSGRDRKSRDYTSPVKLREYMASGTPVAVSDLPSIRQNFSEEELFFFKPDNPRELADTVEYVKENGEEAEERAKNARKRAEGYTWKDRASEILDGLV